MGKNSGRSHTQRATGLLLASGKLVSLFVLPSLLATEGPASSDFLVFV